MQMQLVSLGLVGRALPNSGSLPGGASPLSQTTGGSRLAGPVSVLEGGWAGQGKWKKNHQCSPSGGDRTPSRQLVGLGGHEIKGPLFPAGLGRGGATGSLMLKEPSPLHRLTETLCAS